MNTSNQTAQDTRDNFEWPEGTELPTDQPRIAGPAWIHGRTVKASTTEAMVLDMVEDAMRAVEDTGLPHGPMELRVQHAEQRAELRIEHLQGQVYAIEQALQRLAPAVEGAESTLSVARALVSSAKETLACLACDVRHLEMRALGFVVA